MVASVQAKERKRGFYERRIFPRLMDRTSDTPETRRVRARVCAALHGDVLEVGFGTGHNLPFLPTTVRRVLAVDPLEEGLRLGSARIAAATVPVEHIGLDGQRLPLEDASVDSALSTWTLCSIDDPVAAVREIARVLRPGGMLSFAEHGVAPDEGVRRWQRRLNPLQRRIACGCHLDRDIPGLLRAGGMEIVELTTYYLKGDPKVLGWTFEGLARPAR